MRRGSGGPGLHTGMSGFSRSHSCTVLRSLRAEWSHLAVTGTEAQRACHMAISSSRRQDWDWSVVVGPVLADILSLFFRFTLEQLTESQERQHKGKEEASPAEQIGERGQAPPGPLRSCAGWGQPGRWVFLMTQEPPQAGQLT